MTLTVLNNMGTVVEAGCTVEQAAHALLGYDGHEWEIRPEADGYRLWTSRFSRNSTAFNGLTKSVIFSLADTKEAAEAGIFAEVVANAEWFKGCSVMTDADHRRIVGDLSVEA